MASGSCLGQQKLCMHYGHWVLITILRSTNLSILYTKKLRLNGAKSLRSV